MIQTIENDFLKVSVNDHGAELCSIYDKKNDREVIWQADPTYWKRHAPVLFPNVGRQYDDKYRIGDKTYSLKQHGFARDSVFECVETTDTSITHVLKSSESTKENYPFDFELFITHVLNDNKLSVCWKVVSHSDETMYFTIGAHPAFNVPAGNIGTQDEYSLSFNGEDSLTYLLLDPDKSTAIADEKHVLQLDNGKCIIDKHMFDKGALLFDEQIEKAGITYPDGKPYIEIDCKGYKSFGIWSVPGAGFVCLEPWMGRCDDCGFDGDISTKKYINALDKNEEFNASYDISIY